MVEKLIPVIGHSEPDSFLVAWLNIWAQPILLDPKWNNGDYYDKEPPLAGLTAALKIVSLHANHWEWVNKTHAVVPAEAGRDPAAAFENKFKVETWLDQAAAARAKVSDANHFLYLIKANQLASADPTKIKAPTLVLNAPNDLVFPDALVEQTARRIAASGAAVDRAPLPGPMGHLNGVLAIAQQGDRIRAFLEK